MVSWTRLLGPYPWCRFWVQCGGTWCEVRFELCLTPGGCVFGVANENIDRSTLRDTVVTCCYSFLTLFPLKYRSTVITEDHCK